MILQNVEISKYGDSYVIRIPKQYIKHSQLKVNTKYDMTLTDSIDSPGES